jgi:hypothetical protein
MFIPAPSIIFTVMLTIRRFITCIALHDSQFSAGISTGLPDRTLPTHCLRAHRQHTDYPFWFALRVSQALRAALRRFLLSFRSFALRVFHAFCAGVSVSVICYPFFMKMKLPIYVREPVFPVPGYS